MQSPSVQRFSKTLFVVALTICLVLGPLYLGVVLRWSLDSAGEFFRYALWLVVAALILSTIAGLFPWLYRLTKTKVGHFIEIMQVRIAQQLVKKRVRHLRIPMAIRGITPLNGTVAFSFRPPVPDSVTVGVYLDVIVEHSQQRWGTVEVVSSEPGACLAIPFDRENKDFFASLEDRMNVDPSPPLGVVLVRTVPPEVETFLYELLR